MRSQRIAEFRFPHVLIRQKCISVQVYVRTVWKPSLYEFQRSTPLSCSPFMSLMSEPYFVLLPLRYSYRSVPNSRNVCVCFLYDKDPLCRDDCGSHTHGHVFSHIHEEDVLNPCKTIRSS